MRQEERRKLSTKKLIKACLELADEFGMSAVTFEAIGQKAGYSRGLASQKFGSKAGLMRAVINQLHEEVARARADAHHEGMTGLEALEVFVHVHLNSLLKSSANRAYFVLFCSAIAEKSEMRELFAESHDRSKAELMELFSRGVEDGSVRKDIDVEQAALLTGSQLIGISTQSLADPNFDLERIETAFVSLIRTSYAA